MLQIVGWLGCLYLFVKALEILTSNNHKNDEGHRHVGAIVACGAAMIGSVVFAIWLFVQGVAGSSYLDSPLASSSYPSSSLGEAAVQEAIEADVRGAVDAPAVSESRAEDAIPSMAEVAAQATQAAEAAAALDE